MVAGTYNKHIQKLTSNVCGLRSDSNSAVKKFAFPSLRRQTPMKKRRYTITLSSQLCGDQRRVPEQDIILFYSITMEENESMEVGEEYLLREKSVHSHFGLAADAVVSCSDGNCYVLVLHASIPQ